VFLQHQIAYMEKQILMGVDLENSIKKKKVYQQKHELLTNRLKSGKLKVKDYMNDLRQIIDSDAAKLEGTNDPKK